MKRILCLILALVLALAACSGAPAAGVPTPDDTIGARSTAAAPVTTVPEPTSTVLPIIEGTATAQAATATASAPANTEATPQSSATPETTVAPTATREATATPVMVEYAKYTGDQSLSVFSKPNNTFPKELRITVLKPGEEIKVGEKTSLDGTDWIQFTTKDGEIGYVPNYNFFIITKRAENTASAPKTPETAATPTAPTAETKGVTNLRTGPGTNYDVAGSLPAGSKVEITGKNPDGSWLKVKVNEQEVWLSASLVNQTGPTDRIAVVAVPTQVAKPATPEAPKPAIEAPSAGFIMSDEQKTIIEKRFANPETALGQVGEAYVIFPDGGVDKIKYGIGKIEKIVKVSHNNSANIDYVSVVVSSGNASFNLGVVFGGDNARGIATINEKSIGNNFLFLDLPGQAIKPEHISVGDIVLFNITGEAWKNPADLMNGKESNMCNFLAFLKKNNN